MTQSAQKILPNTINIDFIKNIPLFSGLSEMEKDALLKEGNIHFYPRKKILFRREDPVTHFYVICNGTVRLFYETNDGDDITTDLRIAGDTICTTSIFSSCSTHQTSAQAVHDLTVMEFPTKWLLDAVKQHSTISINLLFSISQHAYKLKAESTALENMSVTQRVSCFLKQTCAIQGLNPNGFELPYSKALIASRLGIAPETFSRTLPKLKKMGITVDGKYVKFHEPLCKKENACNRCPAADKCYVEKMV